MQKSRRAPAQAIVEFAFVVPAMLLLTLGLIEMGRAFMFGVAVQNGTREAARVLVTGDSNQYVLQRLIDASSPALDSCNPVGSGDTDLSGCRWSATITNSGSTGTVVVHTTGDISLLAGRQIGLFGTSLNLFTIQASASLPTL